LVFQTLLFVGYAYAHWLSRRSDTAHRKLHITLLSASVIAIALMALRWPSPITPGASWKPGDADHPVITLIAILVASVGPPFFLLSTTRPLMQYWYSRSTDGTPYKLYALSNVGSLLGLLSYPFLVEPALKLRTRGWVWSALYLAFAAAVVWCASTVRLGRVVEETSIETIAQRSKLTATQLLPWIALPACACVALLAGTGVISLYLVSVPLIWVVPRWRFTCCRSSSASANRISTSEAYIMPYLDWWLLASFCPSQAPTSGSNSMRVSHWCSCCA